MVGSADEETSPPPGSTRVDCVYAVHNVLLKETFCTSTSSQA